MKGCNAGTIKDIDILRCNPLDTDSSGFQGMVECADGDWVMYEDIEAVLRVTAKNEERLIAIIRELLPLAASSTDCSGVCPCNDCDACLCKRDRVLAWMEEFKDE